MGITLLLIKFVECGILCNFDKRREGETDLCQNVYDCF